MNPSTKLLLVIIVIVRLLDTPREDFGKTRWPTCRLQALAGLEAFFPHSGEAAELLSDPEAPKHLSVALGSIRSAV